LNQKPALPGARLRSCVFGNGGFTSTDNVVAEALLRGYYN
jgi:hypothetical protein